MESRQVIESDSMQQNLAYPRRLCKCSEQLHGGGGFLKSSTSTRQSKQDILLHNVFTNPTSYNVYTVFKFSNFTSQHLKVYNSR